MKQITAVICSILLLAACSKSSPAAKKTATMNATETQLVGTWHVSCGIDSINATTNDTLINTSNTSYITFTSDTSSYASVAGSQAKSCTTSGFPAGIPTTLQTYWYYDENNSTLVIYGLTYVIRSVSSTNLVLGQIQSGHTVAVYYLYR